VITAVDTSVLMAIAKGEPDGNDWIAVLRDQGKHGRLVVCDVVLAEMSALFNDDAAATRFFQNLGIDHELTRTPAALLAGRIFHTYRRAGGPRKHLIPDFLIGAHALLQAGQLAAADRGYLRRYFPKLRVIALGYPKAH
jgi:predicted nucleic acid-binding protein